MMKDEDVSFAPNCTSITYDQYFKILQLISQVKTLGGIVYEFYDTKNQKLDILFTIETQDDTKEFNFSISRNHELYSDRSDDILGDLEELEQLVNIALKNKAKITEMIKHIRSKYSDKDINLLSNGITLEKQEKNFWGVEL